MAIPIIAETDLDPIELGLIHELIEQKEYKKGHVFTTHGDDRKGARHLHC